MAIYGLDYYGRSKYGGRRSIAFAVDPFEVQPLGFSRVHLTWSQPAGNWGGFRLVRSRAGFPTTEDDGVTLIDVSPQVGPADSTLPAFIPFTLGSQISGGGGVVPVQFMDQGLSGGWYYYAIFLFNNHSLSWERAGSVDVLVPYDFGSTEKLWNLLPEYYKHIRDNAAGISQTQYRINPAIYLSNEQQVPNEQLIQFLQIFGWGMDLLRTQVDGVLDGYDVDRMHVNRLALLAHQFGAQVELSVSANANRNLVRNLGLLYRKRGTREGIRELLTLLTGWDVQVDSGPNMMLSQDQSDFTSPRVAVWDPTVMYVTGDRVRYGMRLFQALQTAYGLSQAPPETGNNAYWDRDGFIEPIKTRTPKIVRSDTDDISTWQVVGPAGPLPGGTNIGHGTNDPVTAEDFATNSLAFRNTTGAVADIIIRSIPVLKNEPTVFNKRLVIESGVPVPRTQRKWSETTRYAPGDLVLYRGMLFEAVDANTGVIPSSAEPWKQLGYDDRPRLTLSMYTHGPFNGVPGAGGRPVHPYLLEFDGKGNLVQETAVDTSAYSGVFFDPFNEAAAFPIRSDARGTAWTTTSAGALTQGWTQDTGFIYTTDAGRVYRLAPASTANVNVGVTYLGESARLHGVVFRWTDAANFWIATQTGLYKVVAGAAPAAPASGDATYDPFLPGQRLVVTADGTSITVKKNGATVATATDPFNSVGTSHGVIWEA